VPSGANPWLYRHVERRLPESTSPTIFLRERGDWTAEAFPPKASDIASQQLASFCKTTMSKEFQLLVHMQHNTRSACCGQRLQLLREQRSNVTFPDKQAAEPRFERLIPYSAIESRAPLPLGELPSIFVPIKVLELEIGGDEGLAQAFAQDRRCLECPERIEQIEWQALGIFHGVAVGIHVDIEPGARIALLLDTFQARDQHGGLQGVRIGGAVGEAELEAAGIGDADHMGAIVSGIGHRVRRPGRAR
jgi:hypothetical protein